MSLPLYCLSLSDDIKGIKDKKYENDEKGRKRKNKNEAKSRDVSLKWTVFIADNSL